MWPANSNYLNEAVSHMATVLAMSSSHIGFVQYPVIKSQTNQTTLVKHRHALDLLLLKAGLTAYHMVQIAYDKPDSSARDTRCLPQLAMVVFHANFDACDFMESRAVKEGRFGPVRLIRVADMIGFDEARRPAPSARTEQKGLPCHDLMVDAMLQGMNVSAGDRVILLDLLPNRWAEFARAMTERSVQG